MEMRQSSGSSPRATTLIDIFKDAVWYWERRRIVYNAILISVVIIWLVWTWPHFRSALTFQSLAILLVLAVLANLAYCAAYLVEIPLQYSALRQKWRRLCWGLWLLGMLFAVLVENYWIADEIYLYVP